MGIIIIMFQERKIYKEALNYSNICLFFLIESKVLYFQIYK